MLRSRLLFICTANINRSRTAEDLFKNSDAYEVRSAGFIRHSLGGQVVTQALINWADKIFVMDEISDQHLSILRKRFSVIHKRVYVLNILDIYARGNDRLIKLLKSRLTELGIFI